MKKKSIILLATACLTTIGIIGSLGAVKFTVSRAASSRNAIEERILLNNTNRPTITSGTATNVVGYSTIEYFKVADYADGHVQLLSGGWIRKADASKTLDSITVTFNGDLTVYSSYEIDKINYEYPLTTGVSQTLRGNYFKLVANENTNISTISVCYGCDDATNVRMYDGKDIFDGNNWYKAEQSGNTESGAVRGSAMISDGMVRFHRHSDGDDADTYNSHVALFKASENLFIYNTRYSGGMYKNYTDYLTEFNTFNGVRHVYEFGIKTKSTFTMMIGGAVQAWLIPGNASGANQGRQLATYLTIDVDDKFARIDQGSTEGPQTRTTSDGIKSGNNAFSFTNDGATENKIMIILIRENDRTTPATNKDKLILQVYVNGKHVDFNDDDDGTTSLHCKVNESKDYLWMRRLHNNVTKYGPYFGIYPSGVGDDNDVYLSSLNWHRDQNPTGSGYQLELCDTYVTHVGGQGGTPFYNQPNLRCYRYQPNPGTTNCYDGNIKWDFSNLKNAGASGVDIHIKVKLIDKYPNWTPSESLTIKTLDLSNQTYKEQHDWDQKTQTWSTRTAAISWGNMRVISTAHTDYTYDSRTNDLDVKISYSLISADVHSEDNMITILISANSKNFMLNFYSMDAADPAVRPVLYYN